MYEVQELSDRGYTFLVLSIITPIIVCVAVLLRIWIRLFISRSIGLEDGLLIFATFCFTGSSISGAFMALYGFGSHQKTITDEYVLKLFKAMFANGIFIYICVITLRISICLLFLRITQIQWQRYILYSIAIITTIINFVNLLRINIFYCIPVTYYWDVYVYPDGGICVSASVMSALLYLQYIISAIADWVTSLLPLFIMKDWIFNRKAKYVTYGLLGMGIFASGAAVAAIIINPTAADTGDYTYTSYGIFLAQGGEPFFGLLASSFSTYRPLFRSLNATVRERFGSSSNEGSSQSSEESKGSGTECQSFRSRTESTAPM